MADHPVESGSPAEVVRDIQKMLDNAFRLESWASVVVAMEHLGILARDLESGPETPTRAQAEAWLEGAKESVASPVLEEAQKLLSYVRDNPGEQTKIRARARRCVSDLADLRVEATRGPEDRPSRGISMTAAPTFSDDSGMMGDVE